MDPPAGQKLMWFSRASNLWLHVSAALAGSWPWSPSWSRSWG
ncbi:hypothetical protein ACWCPT_12550 [Streptomyces sp. NPDC002308]